MQTPFAQLGSLICRQMLRDYVGLTTPFRDLATVRQVGVEPNHVLLIRQTPPTGWTLAQASRACAALRESSAPPLWLQEVPVGAP